MKAIKVMGIVNEQGQLTLDFPLVVDKQSRVEVIVLISEEVKEDCDPTKEAILNDFRQAWQEAQNGKTIPVEQLWDD